MKITGTRTQIVELPADEPLAGAADNPNGKRPIVTLRVATDEGIEGIGVSYFGGALTRTLKQRDRRAGRALRRRGPAAGRGGPAETARLPPAARRGRAGSTPWRYRRSTSRCGTSGANRSTCRCGNYSAARASASPTYASGALMRGLSLDQVVSGAAHAEGQGLARDEDAARPARRHLAGHRGRAHASRSARRSAPTSS